MSRHSTPSSEGTPVSLAALAGLLLRIGATAFGAYMALLGAAQKEMVERRRWLAQNEWGEIVALVAALPGPMAVSALVCVGYRLRGAAGAWVAGLAILAPSALVMTLFATLHGAVADLPLIRAALAPMPAVVAAIVLAAAWGLRGLAQAGQGAQGDGQTPPANAARAGIAVGAGLACLLGAPVSLAILAAALAGLGMAWRRPRVVTSPTGGLGSLLAAAGVAGLTLAAAWLPDQSTLGQLFIGFAQVSLFMFGGGYAAVPLFHELAVQRHGWVDGQTLADAIALSQLTPGPIMTSAGFIGQQVAGWAGNLAALAGMFLPMAVIAVLLTRAMGGYSQVWWMQGVLSGARPAALGVIAATGLLLAARLDAAWAWATGSLALVLLLRWRVPSYWLVPGAALAGAAAWALGWR